MHYVGIVAVVSDECEPVSVSQTQLLLCSTKLMPLIQSSGAVELEIASRIEMSFLVEMIMDGGVDGDEFLQTSHAPGAEHRPQPHGLH